MKAEELMVGDWVMDTRSNTPLRVNPFLTQLEVPEWEPIPLTSEILVKNGFKKYNSYGTEKFGLNDKVTVNLYGADKWLLRVDVPYNFGTTYIIFRYFHELQHALKLCRINLEIKL